MDRGREFVMGAGVKCAGAENECRLPFRQVVDDMVLALFIRSSLIPVRTYEQREEPRSVTDGRTSAARGVLAGHGGLPLAVWGEWPYRSAVPIGCAHGQAGRLRTPRA